MYPVVTTTHEGLLQSFNEINGKFCYYFFTKEFHFVNIFLFPVLTDIIEIDILAGTNIFIFLNYLLIGYSGMRI